MATDDRRIISLDAGTNLEFVRVHLRFDRGASTNVFGLKNNKTLRQTLMDKRYTGFTQFVLPKYASCLEVPLGRFLLDLKHRGDAIYRQFLNRFGDLSYSTFGIADDGYANATGVYVYYLGDELKYIGRCKDSMKKRVNHGYGMIHPKNCYIDGQSTNCRLNALMTPVRESVSLWLCPIRSVEEIELTEGLLLKRHDSSWNKQRP
jgi:hypothetical protein